MENLMSPKIDFHCKNVRMFFFMNLRGVQFQHNTTKPSFFISLHEIIPYNVWWIRKWVYAQDSYKLYLVKWKYFSAVLKYKHMLKIEIPLDKFGRLYCILLVKFNVSTAGYIICCRLFTQDIISILHGTSQFKQDLSQQLPVLGGTSEQNTNYISSCKYLTL